MMARLPGNMHTYITIPRTSYNCILLNNACNHGPERT
jgi:hypothetical protein